MSATRSIKILWPLFIGAAFSFAACNCGVVGGAELNDPCQSTRDCNSGLACIDTQICATACTSDATCGSGNVCSKSGGCIKTGTCGSSDDCTSNQKCVAPGSCEQRCNTATDCGAGKACLQTGTCAATCTAAAQCATGEKCSSTGSCVPTSGCATSADCGAGQVCNNLGACVADCRTGGCNPGAFCMPGGYCVSTNNPDGGAPTCGGELFQAAKVDSNMLIALDKSGSMADQIQGVSKWNIARNAINVVTTQYDAQIHFGLIMFPTGSTNQTECTVPPVSVTVGPNNHTPIAAAMDGGAPGGKTPIGAVLTACGAVPELADTSRAEYVMLVTDGMETCNGNGINAAAQNYASKGIKTFVIGFGADVDPAALSGIADAGHTARSGTPAYYQADDAAGLATAFSVIAQGALGCEFKLASAPPDPSKLFIYVNGVLQNRDTTHNNGWDYDSTTIRITFYGGLCQLVATDPNSRVNIVYGCRDDSLIEKTDGGAKLPNGAACVTNADCSGGQCSGGLCGQPVGSNCTTNQQCGSQNCQAGKCAAGIN